MIFWNNIKHQGKTHSTGAQTAILGDWAGFIGELKIHVNLASSGPADTAPADHPFNAYQEYYLGAGVWFCFL